MTELRETQLSYRQYPLPLATYDEVIRNPKLFIDTLEKLHAKMGTKFMVPTIGGRELDLHRLFVEVTSRGGIDKIIKDRRWKDVTAVFSFPSTATNASFILRKYYISLLHHYEQIYFFGSRGWIPPPAASLPAPSSAHIPAQGTYELGGSVSETQAMSQKRRRSTGEFLPGGYPVVGVIDGKFEHGYLVTVTVGTQKLRGVLYHTSEHPPVAHVSHFPSGPHNRIRDVAATSGVCRRRRRKKSEMRKRDPSHPKPNRSGYNFFFAEQHARLKPLHPGKDREISRMIGDLWNKLTETEKAVYQERGAKDKERYRSEMEEYRERQKAGPINAVPIQQCLVLPDASSTVDSAVRMEMESALAENESCSEESESEDEKIVDEKVSEVEVLPGAGLVQMGEQSGSASVGEAVEFQHVDQGWKVGDVRNSVAVEQPQSVKNEPRIVAPMELVKNEPLAGVLSESIENEQSNVDEH
ncbi:high mobility group B protein 15-like [Aristolochia californica]|uniref:high mobility group B protein 15-like n=1 Tax=Aristolochia californica TaxID=171875 RepID=UPI0035D72C9A